MKKYLLSDHVRLYHFEEDGVKHSVTLRQIVALIDFSDVKAGSEGGWLDDESEGSYGVKLGINNLNELVD